MTNETNAVADKQSYWQELFGELRDRVSKPCRHPTFVMYFFAVIIVVGGFGLLEPIASRWLLDTLNPSAFPAALVSAAYTYFIAVAATASVDLLLSYSQRRHIRMFFLLCFLVVVLCGVIAALLRNPRDAAYPSVFGYFLALFLWWLGNADNVNLLDTPVVPTAPIGADAKPSGDLAGFNT